jgi:hypothetical protein
MLDTTATMLSRANRWLWVTLLCLGLWFFNLRSMGPFGVAIRNGQLSIEPSAMLQIPLYFGGIIVSVWVSRKYSIPIWKSRTKRAGLSCPFCFHDLRGEPAEAAVCPECGMRYTRTSLKRYWKRIMPAYFLRWSDRKLLRECGLSLPGGEPVDGSTEQPDPHRSPPDAPDDSGGCPCIVQGSHPGRSPVMRSAMGDTTATMLTRANRWLWVMFFYAALMLLTRILEGPFGIAVVRGKLLLTGPAVIQIPMLLATIGFGIWVGYKYGRPLWISRAKRAGLSCPFCFHDLRGVSTEEAVCPDCAMRYTRTGLERYWNRVMPAYFLRWSDRKLLQECGLSMPDGDPVD